MFVWAYKAFYLKSFFLASCSMANILVSFPITLVIYRLVFRIDQFSSLHVMAIFVVIGVAADDVFVFTDTWKQSGKIPLIRSSLAERLDFTWKSAGKAILITSLTTSVAFLATGLSKIMPIASFGFFSAIIVPVNFLLAVIAYPPRIIIYEQKLRHRCRCRCRKTQEQTPV